MSYGQSCYKFVLNDKKSFRNASNVCQKENAALMSITTFQEEQWLVKKLRMMNFATEKRLWIGINDQYSNGDWGWPDNTPGYYRNWNCEWEKTISGSCNKRCIYVFAGNRSSGSDRTGQWGGSSCYSSTPEGYICESSPPSGRGINTVSIYCRWCTLSHTSLGFHVTSAPEFSCRNPQRALHYKIL